MAIDPDTSQRIFAALSEQVNRMLQMGQQPIILTSPAIRMYMRQLVERMMPEIPVLSYNELEPEIEIQSVGVVSI